MLLLRVFSPQANLRALSQAARLIWRQRELIWHMTLRELKDRYAGQALGTAWSIISPLLAMGTYVFAFTFIFRARLGIEDSGFGYTVFVLAGLVPWLAVQDTLSRATSAITGNANLVKQIVFPTEILPIRVALASLPMLFVGLAVIVPLAIASGKATVFGLGILLPAVVMLFVFLITGICYVLAAGGVFLRDVREVVSFGLSIGLFLHPILYPPRNVPGWLNDLFALSPFSHLIWCFRDALVDGAVMHPMSWLILALCALVSVIVGWRFFAMLQPTFGNAL